MRDQLRSTWSMWRSHDWPRADHGATSTEYALMAGFIAAAIVTGVAALGTQVDVLFTRGLDAFL